MPKKSQKSKPSKKEIADWPISAVFAEYLFVILPLVVILIVRLSSGQSNNILSCPEIAFAASILFGQSIVKLVSGFASLDYSINWQNLAAIVSALIVLGLVPSLIVLALILLNDKPTGFLQITQFSLFVLSSLCMFMFGTMGQEILTEHMSKK